MLKKVTTALFLASALHGSEVPEIPEGRGTSIIDMVDSVDLGTKEYRETIKNLLAVAESDEERERLRIRLVEVLGNEAEKSPDNEEVLRELIAVHLRNNDFYNAAVLLWELGDYQKGEEYFVKALENDGSKTLAAERLMKIYERRRYFVEAVEMAIISGDLDQAHQYLKSAVEANLGDAEILNKIARIYEKIGNLNQAARYYIVTNDLQGLLRVKGGLNVSLEISGGDIKIETFPQSEIFKEYETLRKKARGGDYQAGLKAWDILNTKLTGHPDFNHLKRKLAKDMIYLWNQNFDTVGASIDELTNGLSFAEAAREKGSERKIRDRLVEIFMKIEDYRLAHEYADDENAKRTFFSEAILEYFVRPEKVDYKELQFLLNGLVVYKDSLSGDDMKRLSELVIRLRLHDKFEFSCQLADALSRQAEVCQIVENLRSGNSQAMN